MARRRHRPGSGTDRHRQPDSGTVAARLDGSVDAESVLPQGRSGPVHRQDHQPVLPARSGDRDGLRRQAGRGAAADRADGDQRDEGHHGGRTSVVRDIVTGALEERTSDWYAQDASGNVWYFGEDTKEYTNGVVSSTAGSWEAGVDGALPGIIMQANPVQGDAYRQEYRPTVAEDVALIKQVGASAEVPAGRYSDVLVTNDRDLLDLNKDEDKYFAPGVGLVKLGGLVNGHREDVWLVSILAPK